MSEEPRVLISLGPEGLEGIRDLVSNQRHLRQIYDACASDRPASSVMALAVRIGKKLQLETTRVYDVLFALWNLSRFYISSKLPPAEFLSQISMSMGGQPSDDRGTLTGWSETAAILAPILPDITHKHQLFISQQAQKKLDGISRQEGRALPHDDAARQREIELLRALHADEFDRVKHLMPSRDDLRSLTVEAPRELLDEEW